jgi:hypothetical protein
MNLLVLINVVKSLVSSASLHAFPNKGETHLPVTTELLRLGHLGMGSPKKSDVAVGFHTLEK